METTTPDPAALRATILRLYNTACHGFGAQPRSAARVELEAMFEGPMYIFFSKYQLDLSAYFASRPIAP